MSYTNLSADIVSFMGARGDLPISRLVALTEYRLNRLLRVRQQEEPITGTITAGEIALPADYAATKVLQVADRQPLLPQSLEAVLARDDSGIPSIYAVTGDAWVFDGSGDVTGVYFKKIPGLQANSNNWLSDMALDVYLFGCLEEAYRYVNNDQQSMAYRQLFLDSVAELQRMDSRDRLNGPLVSQVR